MGSTSRATLGDGATAPSTHPQEGARTRVLAAVRLPPRATAAPPPKPSGPVARWVTALRARAQGSAWVPLFGKIGGYVAGFVALALVGSGAASWRPGAAGGALVLGLGPPSAPASAAASAPAVAVAGALGVDEPDHAASVDGGVDSGVDAGAPDGAAPADAGASAGGITADGRVVLNLASEEELRRLPGVGPSKARAIVAMRTKLGKFKRPEDLLRVKGIGRRSLARMRPLLLVDAP